MTKQEVFEWAMKNSPMTDRFTVTPDGDGFIVTQPDGSGCINCASSIFMITEALNLNAFVTIRGGEPVVIVF